VPLFPGKPVFCQWNLPDPQETKASDAEPARAFGKSSDRFVIG
jgi:hypothetical protein